MTLHFAEKGKSKTTLILLHAFPLNHAMWTHQLEGLSGAARVVAPDLPGFGRSQTLRGDANMAEYAKNLLAWMDGQKIESAVFGGCSMGGYILFELWRQAQKRVNGLILCDTRMEADSDEARQNRMDAIDQIRNEGLGPLAGAMPGKLLGATTQAEKPELAKTIKETIQKNSAIGVIHALQAMASRPDSTETLESISVPTLLLVGGEDAVTPPSAARAIADKLPDAQYAEIANAGHLSPWEQPQAVNEAILGFLKKGKR